ncbi:MAG: pseudouridine synthase [Myxococcota bacterium]
MIGPPRLLAQRDQLWVLYKPAGFAVHRASDRNIPDLMTWASEHLPLPKALAPIHRLDRDTSGLVLCSPDTDTRSSIGRLCVRTQARDTL